MQVELPQELAAVLSAIQKVIDMTGFGKVTVEIKDGHVRMIEIAASTLIKRKDGIIDKSGFCLRLT